MNNGDESNEGILSYPSMEEGAEGRIERDSSGGLDTTQEPTEEPSVEFSEEDQSTLNEMTALVDSGEYDDLAGLVEDELRGLDLGEEDLASELNLLKYAKEYATESPEWRKWIRGALNNLFTYKAKARGK